MSTNSLADWYSNTEMTLTRCGHYQLTDLEFLLYLGLFLVVTVGELVDLDLVLCNLVQYLQVINTTVAVLNTADSTTAAVTAIATSTSAMIT